MGKKWNQDAKPAEKLLALYTILLFGRAVSLTELSTELNCAKQTVSRLITQLEASRYGKVIRLKKGHQVFYQLDGPERLPKFSLNAEGLRQLALCRDFAAHLLPENMRQNVEATLKQAAAFLSDSEKEKGNNLHPTGYAIVKGRINYTDFQEQLNALWQAIQASRVCDILYQPSFYKEASRFEYAPKGLIIYNNTYYIRGWIVTEKGTAHNVSDTPHTLALHRCKEVILTKRTSAHLPEPPNEHPGAFGFIDNVPFEASIHFHKDAATYIAEREWSEEQKVEIQEDGSVILSVVVRSLDEFIAWILTFGDKSEVIKPDWLRKEVAEKIFRLSNNYR